MFWYPFQTIMSHVRVCVTERDCKQIVWYMRVTFLRGKCVTIVLDHLSVLSCFCIARWHAWLPRANLYCHAGKCLYVNIWMSSDAKDMASVSELRWTKIQKEQDYRWAWVERAMARIPFLSLLDLNFSVRFSILFVATLNKSRTTCPNNQQ